MQKLSLPETVPLGSRPWLRLLGLGMVLVALGILLLGLRPMLSTDPYVEAVLATPGNVERGESLFELNCAACHGTGGVGRVGPSLIGIRERRSDRFIINQVTGGNTPPMPQFQPDAQDMADLIEYLKTL
ncbi:MAG: cytochrome c [Thermostichales cyanobacterium BF3_bins_165]